MIRISELTIKPVQSNDSLIGFCSMLINYSLKLNNLAIHKRLDGGIRIVYPKSPNQIVQNVYPISQDIGKYIEKKIYEVCVNEGVLSHGKS